MNLKLHEKTNSYLNWANKLKEIESDFIVKKQIDYWNNVDAINELSLRNKKLSFATFSELKNVTLVLDADVTQKIEKFLSWYKV